MVEGVVSLPMDHTTVVPQIQTVFSTQEIARGLQFRSRPEHSRLEELAVEQAPSTWTPERVLVVARQLVDETLQRALQGSITDVRLAMLGKPLEKAKT